MYISHAADEPKNLKPAEKAALLGISQDRLLRLETAIEMS